jgi:plastocyanin
LHLNLSPKGCALKLIAVAVVLVVAGVGVVLLADVGPQTRAGAAGDWVDVVLQEQRFTPNRLDARAGVPLTVRLTNRSTEAHDLYFPSAHMPGLTGAQTYVEPGQTSTLTLVFDREGVHAFGCSLQRHAGTGMTGAVFVAP